MISTYVRLWTGKKDYTKTPGPPLITNLKSSVKLFSRTFVEMEKIYLTSKNVSTVKKT
jgi:hypothetical protein